MNRPRRPILAGNGRARIWAPSSKRAATPADPRALRALRAAGRILLWTLLAVLVLRGAFPPAPARPRPAPRGTSLPAGLQAFAVGFATEYLTVGPEPSERVARLAAVASPELAADLAASGKGRLRQGVLLAVPAGVSTTLGGFTVEVAARVSPSPGGRPRWVWLAVPIAARDGALAVAAPPSVVSPPELLQVLPAPPEASDPALSEGARPVLERFFSSYLGAGDPGELAYLTSPGARLDPPPRFAGRVFLEDLAVRRDGRGVVATVDLLARDREGLRWPLAYQVRLAERAGRLEVTALSPLPPAFEEVMVPRTP